MQNILFSVFSNPIVAFIILAGVVVFVHELGHYIAGRLLGIDVEEFSLGFGPKAYSFKRGMTEFRISWVPLGGYVRFYGAEIGGNVPLAKRERGILTAKLYKRAVVSVAGPLANFVLAVVIMIFLYNIGIPKPAAIIAVIPGSPAEKGGLKSGDKILSVSGNQVHTWMDLDKNVGPRAGKDVPIEVQRGEERLKVTVVPSAQDTDDAFGEQTKRGRIGVTQFMQLPRVVVAKGSLLETLGLKSGDTVSAVDGRKVSFAHELDLILKAKLGIPAEAGVSGLPQNIPDAYPPFEIKVSRIQPAADDASGNARLAENLSSPQSEKKSLEETVSVTVTREKILAFTHAAGGEIQRNIPLILSTDQLISRFEAFPRGDKRTASVEAWDKCGIGAGTTLVAINEVGGISNLVQVIGWLDSVQRKANNPRTDVRTYQAKMTIVGTQGEVKNVTCDIPLREGKDPFNRERLFIDFPARFATNGVPSERVLVKSESLVASVSDGASAAWEQLTEVAEGLKRFATGRAPVGALGGPIAIARTAGAAAEGGVIPFVLMISFLSINVGLFNFLPLPALDGGTLLLHGVEAAYGKPLPVKVQENVQKVGILFILALFVVVFYNDILRIFS